MKYEEYEKIIEKINFEEKWLSNLDLNNRLNKKNVEIAMSAIKNVLRDILKGSNENG